MAFKFNPFTGTLDIDEGVTDGDKGDIIVSGDTWTIDANAVDFSKMQDIAAYKLIGRHTVGSGDPQQVGIDGGTEFQGANIQRSALTGDVTANAGSSSTTIPATTISGKALLTPLTGTEEILINDSGTLKKTTSQDVADLAGDVNGPSSSINNGIVLFNGTTGKLIKDSVVPMLESGTMALHIGKSSTLSPVIEATTYGNNIVNTVRGATVIGYNANNSGGALCIGAYSSSTGSQSFAIGNSAVASANFTFALGASCEASVANALAIGYSVKSRGSNSIAIAGVGIEAYNNDCFIGNYSRGVSTSYSNTVAVGSSSSTSVLTCNNAVVIHCSNANAANNTVNIGYNSYSSASNGVVVGYQCVMTTGHAAYGYNTTVASTGACVFGQSNSFSDSGFAHVFGSSNSGTTGGSNRFIFGNGNTTTTFSNIFMVGRSGAAYESNTIQFGSSSSRFQKLFIGSGQKSAGTIADCYYSMTSPTTVTNRAGYNLYILGSGSTGTAKGGWVYQSVVTATSASGTTENNTKVDITIATSYGEFITKAQSSAPIDANIPVGFISSYIDETGNFLKTRVRYSSGTYKTASLKLFEGTKQAIVSKSANYTLTGEESTVTVNDSGGDVTITMPNVSTYSGYIYIIKKTSASNETILSSSDLIDGALTATLTVQYESITLQSDGSTWWIL